MKIAFNILYFAMAAMLAVAMFVTNVAPDEFREAVCSAVDGLGGPLQ